MNKFYLLSLMVLIPYFLMAQQPEESQVKLRQVTPPSPQASALGKYGDIPVGNFTGTADLSIPIYNLRIKDFTLPVAISYHTGGIKVEETATNVGLGWALSYGGNISVSVNGQDDFSSYGFCNVIGDPLKRLPDQPFQGGSIYNWQADGGGDLYKFAVNAAEGTTDTEPDLHYYSIPGNSGKFYFDQYGQAHTIPMSALKIQHFVNKYQITDEKGIVYSFEDVDQSIYDNTCSGQSPTANFLLTKILLPDNNWITFTYVNNQYALVTAKPESRTKLVAGQYGPSIIECTNVANTGTMKERVITKIESSVGTTIQFNYGTDRLDLPGTKNLASITVSYQGQTKKTYEFRQSYFSGTESRLKLDKVICNTNQIYEFEYETSVSLPSRLSFSQDHWGYYNNKSNTTLLPIDIEYGFTTGADRSPDFNYAKMAILKKVIYPTKGYTILEYEPNDYVFSGVKNVDTEKNNSIYSVADQTVTKQFTIPEAPTQILSVRAFYNAVAMNPGDEIPVDAPCSISLSGPNGYFRGFQGVSINQGELLTGLAPGNYTMYLTTTGSYPSGYFTVSVVERTSATVTENKEIGGLRVKRRTDYDAVTSNNKVTRYLYKDEKTGLSTGKINFQPQYTYLYTHANMKDVISFTNYWKQATSSIFPLGSIKGGSVAYTTVTVLNGENGENGKTVYNYSFFPPHNIQMSFPLVPTSNEDWHNGLLLNEKSYKYNGPNNFSLLSQTINYYSDKKEEDFWNAHYSAQSLKANEYLRGWAIKIIYKNPPATSGLSFTPATFNYNDYHLESKWLRLDSTVTRQYYGTDSVSTSQLFEYGNPAHFLKTKQTLLASNKIKYSTEFKYPQDSFTGLSATAETARQQLIAKNNITALMETSRYVGTTKLEQLQTSYKVFGNLCLPEIIEAQTGGSALEKRIQFNNYNTYGNLLNQSLVDGAKIAYQWSAASQSLLAECKNAAENEFYFESFEEDIAASIVKFHTGTKCNYNRGFTIPFTKPNTRTYLISWFEFDGSKWVYKEETYTGSKTFMVTQYVDDIRVFPFDAQMTSYTYDPLVGITSATDAKGQTTYYEYDPFGRLKYIKDANGNILKEHTYNYKQ